MHFRLIKSLSFFYHFLNTSDENIEAFVGLNNYNLQKSHSFLFKVLLVFNFSYNMSKEIQQKKTTYYKISFSEF
jgi:hypothetical protein